ncbi:S-layer homology domain-containing protein [Paenibacillus ehimensis]|uniref:S-layer homology domain-containing protein n=1 Tax=Paenibacillus ehimensis TaxID=79264 RepID=UPI0034E2E806
MIHRRSFLSLLSIIMLFCGISTAHAEEIKFQDVSGDHQAYDTIQWAIKEKIVDGYPIVLLTRKKSLDKMSLLVF